MKYLWKLYIAFDIFYCIFSQKLSWLEYRQNDSETKCQQGLISNGDVFVLKGRLDYSFDRQIRNIQIQIKREKDTKFILFRNIEIQTDCTEIQNDVCKHVSENVVEFAIKDKVSKELSRAKIRPFIIASSSKEIIGDEEIFPFIEASTDSKINLKYNGKMITNVTKNCSISVTSNEDHHIDYICESQVSPCFIEVHIDDIKKTFEGVAKLDLKRYFNNRKQVQVKARYAPCRLVGSVNEILCTFHSDYRLDSTSILERYTQPIVIGILGFLVVAFLIYIIYKRIKTKSSQKKNAEKNAKSNQQEDEHINLLQSDDKHSETINRSSVKDTPNELAHRLTFECTVPTSDEHGRPLSVKEIKAKILESRKEV